MRELEYASAKQLVRAIRRKQVSSLEVVDAYIKRIQEVNPKLNAVVQLKADQARAEARRADAALARGKVNGPLHGLPVTIKDAIDTAGIVSTGGTKGRASYVPKQDATVVTRLKAAGAIVLGKTNTPELTLGGMGGTSNDVYGRTNNPYDLSRTPGGSSGGEAVIIAAGGSPLGLGGDSGGSIRGPCHLCGIAGIKPSAGRVPRTGHILPPGGLWDSWTLIGPMARYVEDLSLALPIIIGPDGRDPFVVPMPLGNASRVPLRTLRGAYYTDNGVVSPTKETQDTVRAAVETLAEFGVQMEERQPPGIGQGGALGPAFMRADDGAWVWRGLRAAGTTKPGVGVQMWLDQAPMPHLTTADYLELVIKWDDFRSGMTAFMEHYDFIVCPAGPQPATRHDDYERNPKPGGNYTFAYNLTGWPAVVLRGGTSPRGLPIGVQVAAKPWRDDVALAVAQHLEKALGGWQPPPL